MPGLQFLHCIVNEAEGGESIFRDSLGALKELETSDQESFKVLRKVPVRFMYKNDKHHMNFFRPTIEYDINEGYGVVYAPQFQGPLKAHPSIITKFYKAFSAFEEILNRDEAIYRHTFRKGDLVIFANRRVLHGRESFGNSGDRWLKGTYVGWDEFKDKLRCNFPNQIIE